jgi:hypothetical protein
VRRFGLAWRGERRNLTGMSQDGGPDFQLRPGRMRARGPRAGRRAQSFIAQAETAAGKAILARIRKRELSDGFTARDIYRHGWSNLSDRGHVQSGLDLLADLDWLVPNTTATGGRASVAYSINPWALR